MIFLWHKFSKMTFAALACLSLSTSFGAGIAYAQDAGTANGSASTANVSGITASNSVGNDASAQSGGNIFDFSNRSKSMGNAPGLPSFAGGPCMGVSTGVSASLPGFGFGGAKSFDDESCQRRNWVQTLIGAAQHMPPTEAAELKRVAVVVMMQDPILGAAFEKLGYDVHGTGQGLPSKGTSASTKSEGSPISATKSTRKTSIASMERGCVAVVPKNATAAFEKLVAARGCQIERR